MKTEDITIGAGLCWFGPHARLVSLGCDMFGPLVGLLLAQ